MNPHVKTALRTLLTVRTIAGICLRAAASEIAVRHWKTYRRQTVALNDIRALHTDPLGGCELCRSGTGDCQTNQIITALDKDPA